MAKVDLLRPEEQFSFFLIADKTVDTFWQKYMTLPDKTFDNDVKVIQKKVRYE